MNAHINSQTTEAPWFNMDKPLVIQEPTNDLIANSLQSLNPPVPSYPRAVREETLLARLHSATDLLLKTEKTSHNLNRYFRNWLKVLEEVVNALKNKFASNNQQPVPVAAS